MVEEKGITFPGQLAWQYCRVYCHGFYILHCNLEASSASTHTELRLIKYTIMAHKVGPKKDPMHTYHGLVSFPGTDFLSAYERA